MNRININTASRQELINLKGIGSIIADRIIAARTYTSEEDVIAIKGIGVNSLQNIKQKNSAEFIYDKNDDSSPVFSTVLNGPIIMRTDIEGEGHWGADRGSLDHLGIDIECVAGESIFTPIDGKVTKHGWPTASKPNLRYVEVTGRGADAKYRVRLMYSTISDSIRLNDLVKRGDIVRVAQSVSAEYRLPNMKDHIHYELFLDGNNRKVDPTDYVFG